jgi:hypothetical protein
MKHRETTCVKILVSEDLDAWENQPASYETIQEEAGSTDAALLQWAHDRARRFDIITMLQAREYLKSPAGNLLVYRPN